MGVLPDIDFQSLEQKSWGLLLAYGLLALGIYLFLWSLIEPANIPDQINTERHLPSSRLFYHLVATTFLTGHALLVAIFVRWLPKIRESRRRSEDSEVHKRDHLIELEAKDSELAKIQRELQQSKLRIKDLEKELVNLPALRPPLSELDRRILGLLAPGQALSAEEIADKLHIMTRDERDQLYLSLDRLREGQKVVPENDKLRRAS
jgi:hypothetical protein